MARVDTSLVMRGAPILANSRMNRSHPSIPVEQIGDKNTYLFSGSDPCAARTYDDRRSAIASFHGRGQHARCVNDWRISTCASDYAVGPAKQLQKYYWTFLLHTIAFGFWSYIGVFTAPLAILTNTIRYRLCLTMTRPVKLNSLVPEEQASKLARCTDEIRDRLLQGESLRVVCERYSGLAGLSPGQVAIRIKAEFDKLLRAADGHASPPPRSSRT